MWHNLLSIGGVWLIALVFAWLICRWRGYNAPAWAFTISAFCLGLFVGAENTTHGRFKVPFLSGPTIDILHTKRPVGSGRSIAAIRGALR